MKTHGLNFVGPIKIEVISTLPEWTIDDLGRFVYVSGEDKFYNGKSTGWEESGGGGGVDESSLKKYFLI